VWFASSDYAERLGVKVFQIGVPRLDVTEKGPLPTRAEADSVVTASVAPDVETSLQPLRQALQNPAATVQRMNSLFAFNAILAEYGRKTGAYPNSQDRLVSARKAMDIVQDAEFFRNVPAGLIDQMQYVSNGKSYKVIIVGAGDCAVVRVLRPAMVDPKRSSGPLDCVAYGYWSPLGAGY
jgi:hypothetical protein